MNHPTDWDKVPSLTIESGDAVRRLLQAISRVVLQHPAVAQELFQLLVAEGRAFVATEEGQALRRALADSDLVRHGRALWESSSLNILEDAPGVVLPSAMVDGLVHLLGRPDFLTRLQDAAAR